VFSAVKRHGSCWKFPIKRKALPISPAFARPRDLSASDPRGLPPGPAPARAGRPGARPPGHRHSRRLPSNCDSPGATRRLRHNRLPPRATRPAPIRAATLPGPGSFQVRVRRGAAVHHASDTATETTRTRPASESYAASGFLICLIQTGQTDLSDLRLDQTESESVTRPPPLPHTAAHPRGWPGVRVGNALAAPGPAGLLRSESGDPGPPPAPTGTVHWQWHARPGAGIGRAAAGRAGSFNAGENGFVLDTGPEPPGTVTVTATGTVST
jgi:hypothetical protein